MTIRLQLIHNGQRDVHSGLPDEWKDDIDTFICKCLESTFGLRDFHECFVKERCTEGATIREAFWNSQETIAYRYIGLLTGIEYDDIQLDEYRVDENLILHADTDEKYATEQPSEDE
jgi:hypothetical protein